MALGKPQEPFDFEAFKADTLDPEARLKITTSIRDKLLKSEALTPQEEAFREEDDTQREVDPFGELEGFMESVFTCLKAGTTTPTEASKAFQAMLTQQRKIYNLTQQKKQLEG